MRLCGEFTFSTMFTTGGTAVYETPAAPDLLSSDAVVEGAPGPPPDPGPGAHLNPK